MGGSTLIQCALLDRCRPLLIKQRVFSTKQKDAPEKVDVARGGLDEEEEEAQVILVILF